jgi:hypothetical protein
MNPLLLLLLPVAYFLYEKRAASAPAGSAPAPSSTAQLPANTPTAPAPAPAPAPVATQPTTPASTTSSTSSSGGVSASQAVTGAAPWDPTTMSDPAVSGVTLPAIPGSYSAQSAETTAIQQALNAWAAATLYPNPQAVDAIATDGIYGPDTQTLAAAFQTWQNATAPGSNLTIDGLAGPATQNFLLDFGPMTPGGY